MVKNVILLGAGASYGSDNAGIPPLTADLFDELKRFNPIGWGNLPNSYAVELQDDFERGIIKISNERSHDLPILQRAMGAYFFSFRPKNTNLYYRLAQEIKNHSWDGALSTINYERLLEISLLAADMHPIIGVPTSNQIELNLPHGCCHLFCESTRANAGAVSFSGMKVRINGEIKVIGDRGEFQQRINNDAFPPVMSYFEPQKRATAGQSFLEEQRTRFKELVKNAERIVVIGVKIRPHDSHIWDPISDTNADFIYCSGVDERDMFIQWTNQYREGKNNDFKDGYWNEKFEEILSIVEL